MSVPNAYAVRIFVNQVNVTSYAPYDKMRLEDYRSTTSDFEMLLQNPSFTPTKGMKVYVFAPDLTDDPTIFSGYIVEIEEVKRDDGIVPEYRLTCADNKIRLQKSNVPFDDSDYIGSDTDILDNLFENAYPTDIVDSFDLSNVNSVASSLDLPVNDDNLLDLLKDLSKQAGADYSFSRGSANQRISFNPNADAIKRLDDNPGAPVWWDYFDSVNFVALGVGSGGNPGDCIRWSATILSTAVPDEAGIQIAFGGNFTVANIVFDVLFDFNGSSLNITKTGGGGTLNTAVSGVWQTINWSTAMGGAGLPFSGTGMQLVFRNNSNAAGSLYIRLDNIRVFTTEPFAREAGADELNWDSTPPSAPFDLDIDVGDEYGAGFDLDIGGWDDYNAVIVTGGSEQIAIDWTYHGNQYQEHYPLEAPIKDLVVYKNTNTDPSPSWALLTLGKWGVDDIGTKDVLYDEANHWLLFNVALLNLNRAFRLTGSIKKPLRVLVENYASGDVVYATTLYDENATTPEAAANIGFAFLEEQNAIRRLNFTTPHPGLKVGQEIQVTDSARGLDETTTIQKITTTWIGASGHAKFYVECGIDEYSDASSLIAANDKRSREKAVPVPIGLTTANHLTDRNGNILTDRNGARLYQLS